MVKVQGFKRKNIAKTAKTDVIIMSSMYLSNWKRENAFQVQEWDWCSENEVGERSVGICRWGHIEHKAFKLYSTKETKEEF